ncbi:queuosine precursor transporter [Caenispirillum bisanense]|uniref:queuosine precursor transporter n=1 Tax=Caenispirillum bisanense TaxID=414052 RepID=UPI0031D85F2D
MNRLVLPVAAMAVIVVASNILVQYPINDWLTWGALTYPFAFLVTDLTNRTWGPAAARRVVTVGFLIAVVMSAWLATPRIAAASGAAFLIAQLLDVTLFDRLRHLRQWWAAPLASSTVGSAVDTAIFFAGAFMLTDVPWVSLAVGDYGVKLGLALLMLVPFRVAIRTVLAKPSQA